MAFDGFLKLDGITGESQDKVHQGEIELSTFSWGASTGFGLISVVGARPVVQDFTFTVGASAPAPQLLARLASGQHIPNAVLSLRKAGGATAKAPVDYMKIKMTDAVVSGFKTTGNTGDDVPSIEVALNFASIEIDYYPIAADGSVGTAITGTLVHRPQGG